MHAYLIIGKDTFKKETEILEKLNGKALEFPISKIEEVRQLTDFLKNTQPENTIIISHNIDLSTQEALNAFLKSLEEPQKNVSFILTARNEYKILPTITSRCQIIRAQSNKPKAISQEASIFLKSKTGERFLIIDKIKSRSEAIIFMQNLIEKLHLDLNQNPKNYKGIAKHLEESQKTLNALEANGNVNLQLTNLVVNLMELS